MNENKLVIKRVEEEYYELRRKYEKLKALVDNIDKIHDITKEHKELLKVQLSVMYQYLYILERRLNLFKE